MEEHTAIRVRCCPASFVRRLTIPLGDVYSDLRDGTSETSYSEQLVREYDIRHYRFVRHRIALHQMLYATAPRLIFDQATFKSVMAAALLSEYRAKTDVTLQEISGCLRGQVLQDIYSVLTEARISMPIDTNKRS